MNLKIRHKIIGVMVILIILPIFLLGLSSYKTSYSALKGQYEDMGEIIANETNLLMQNKISDTNKMVMDLSELPAFNDIEDEENVNRVLGKLLTTMNIYKFEDVYFASTNGNIYSPSDLDLSGVVVQEQSWYTDALETEEVVWSEIYKDENTGKNQVTISRAVYTGDVLKGVLAINMDLLDFSGMVANIDIMGGYPIVMDQEGTIIAHQITEEIGTKFQASDDFDKDNRETQMKEYTYKDKQTGEEQKQLILHQYVEGSDWRVATIVGMDALDKLTFKMMRNILTIGLITLTVAVFISILFGRNISNSINEVLNAIRWMEEGDFTTRLDTKSTDEFGELRDRFNKMMVTLSAFIEKIKDASTSVDEYSENLAAISEEVNASSYEVSTTVEQIAKGASSQANDTEDGVVLINQMSDKLLELDDTSESMVGLTEEIRSTNEESAFVVNDLKEKTELNNASSQEVKEEIIELDKRISKVTEILSTIDTIAEQTNLLALNASIEAARAGEYGRGFAVVADEIRQLAGESKESSSNIKSIIEAVQHESKVTVNLVGEVTDRNKEQTEAVERVNLSFDTINNLIEQIVSKIDDIDEKSTEMNNDRGKIVGTIENISSVSQETAAASEEVTASIEEQTSATEDVANSASKLSELARELNNEISVFKI